MGKKKRKKQQKHSKKREEPSLLSWLVYIGVCLLLFYPPYFRGLFFRGEQLLTLLLTLIIYGMWWLEKLRRKEHHFFHGSLDYIALGFVLTYFLAILVAANPRAAVREALKVGNYFLLFWLIVDIARSRRDVTIFLKVLLASGLGVALLGLGVAAGTWEYNDAFVGGRIASSLQYPNTLAAYLATLLMVSLAFWAQAEKRLEKALYGAGSYILLLTFIFTQSRGAFLILPLGLAVLLWLMPRGYRVKIAGCILITVVVTGLTAPLVGQALNRGARSLLWLGVLLGAVLVPLAEQALILLAKQPLKRKLIFTVAGLAATGVLAGVYVARAIDAPIYLGRSPGSGDRSIAVEEVVRGLAPEREYILTAAVQAENKGEEKPYAWRIVVTATDSSGGRNNLADVRGGATEGWERQEITFTTPAEFEAVTVRLLNYYEGTSARYRDLELLDQQTGSTKKLTFAKSKLLPAQVVNRLSTISLRERSARERLVWSADALKIIKDYPLLGTGGGGWQALYHQYQDYLYWTTEVHNHWLQVGVETGFIGLGFFVALWCLFLYTVWKIRSLSDDWTKIMTAGIAAGAINLGLHSFIDFNLSLPAVSFVLWSLFGTGFAVARLSTPGRDTVSPAKSTRVPTLVLVLTLVFIAAVSSLYMGYSLGQRGAKAAREGRIAQARELFSRAISFDPFTAAFYLDLAQIEEIIGELPAEEVCSLYERGLALEPYKPTYHLKLGRYLLKQGDIDKGLFYIKRSLELDPYNVQVWENLAAARLAAAQYLQERGEQDRAEEILREITAMPAALEAQSSKTPEELRDLARRPLRVTPKLLLTLGKAHYLLGDKAGAVEYFKEAAKNKDLKSEAEEWLKRVDREQQTG